MTAGDVFLVNCGDKPLFVVLLSQTINGEVLVVQLGPYRKRIHKESDFTITPTEYSELKYDHVVKFQSMNLYPVERIEHQVRIENFIPRLAFRPEMLKKVQLAARQSVHYKAKFAPFLPVNF